VTRQSPTAPQLAQNLTTHGEVALGTWELRRLGDGDEPGASISERMEAVGAAERV